MNRRQIGYLGIGAWVLFWTASVVLGALRPSYSHVANTVSELGAVGTPHAAAWNVLGFIVPGILLAITGAAVARAVIPTPSVLRAVATVLLVLSGVAIAGQGLMPAEMVNGVADVTSASTRAHFVSSLVSGAAWAVAVFLLIAPMKRNPEWRGLWIVSVALLLLVFGASLVLRGNLPDGLAQRIGNAFFCAWFLVMSLRLVRLPPATSADFSAAARTRAPR